MENIYFKFHEHPGDLLRSDLPHRLPNPKDDLDDFLVQFLPNFQSNETVTYLDDLYKLLDNDFYDENDKLEFIELIGNKTSREIKEEIYSIQNELTLKAYENFYHLILTNKIEIINGQK